MASDLNARSTCGGRSVIASANRSMKSTKALRRGELREIPARAERDIPGTRDQGEAQILAHGMRLEHRAQLLQCLARKRVASGAIGVRRL